VTLRGPARPGGASALQAAPVETEAMRTHEWMPRLLAFGILLIACARAPIAQAQFTVITKNPLGQNGMGFGVSWVDVDQDGDDDLYLTYDGPNVLLRNDGADQFTDISASPIDDGSNSGSGVWGDADGDGDLDLYLVNYLTANHLFRNEGASGFTDITSGPLGDAGAGQGAAWADVDRDGDLDLYLVNYGTPNKLFRNQGGGVFVDATSGPLGDAGWGVAVAWGDFDGDGDPDLYLTNDGPNRLLRNDGSAFTRVTGLAIEDSGAGQGAAWGDFDNDGDLDLYIANYGTASKLLRNEGGGAFTALTAGPLGDRGNSTGVVWGDFDNDGDLDLYRTSYGSGNALLRNDGGGVFVALTSGPLGDADNCDGVAASDTDLDGDLDLYVVKDGHANALLRNDLAAGSHWLELRLTGTVSNRSAIGARVRVVAGALRQIREVSGGSGYLSQSSLTIHVGLGASTVADSVTVIWPSGLVTRLQAVAANQRLALDEQGAVAVGGTDPSPVFQLEAPAPNPAIDGATLRFHLPRAASVRLGIYDVQGRCVASLIDGHGGPGPHEVRWDGQDGRGRKVAAGVHFVRLEAGPLRATRKLIVLP